MSCCCAAVKAIKPFYGSTRFTDRSALAGALARGVAVILNCRDQISRPPVMEEEVALAHSP